jgi:hypothetical protein
MVVGLSTEILWDNPCEELVHSGRALKKAKAQAKACSTQIAGH